MSVMNKEAHHLEQSQISSTNVVEIDLDILPANFAVVRIDEFKALRLVVHLVQFEVFLRSFIEAVVILPRKQVDAHDTENQPKDEANQQHIHNGRDGTHQGVDYNLEQEWRDKAVLREDPETVHACSIYSYTITTSYEQTYIKQRRICMAKYSLFNMVRGHIGFILTLSCITSTVSLRKGFFFVYFSP